MGPEELIARRFRQAEEGNHHDEPTGFPISLREAEALCGDLSPRQRAGLDGETIAALDVLLAELLEKCDPRSYMHQVKDLEGYAWFKARRTPELERAFVTLTVILYLIDQQQTLHNHYVKPNTHLTHGIVGLLYALAGRKMKMEVSQALTVIESARRKEAGFKFDWRWLDPAVAGLEAHRAEIQFDASDTLLLSALRTHYGDWNDGKHRAAAMFLREILGTVDEGEEQSPLWDGEEWAAEIGRSLAEAPAELRTGLMKVLKHAGTASAWTSKASKSWLKQAQGIVDSIGHEAAGKFVAKSLKLFAAAGARPDPYDDYKGFGTNTGHMTGMAHIARCCDGPDVIGALCDVVEGVARLKHAPREGSANVAKAALGAIEASDDPMAAASLSRLALRLRWPKLRKAVEKSFNAYLERKGLSRDDVEEASVPDYGLKDGVVEIPVGDAVAKIELSSGDRPRVTWVRADKPPTHVTPKALKASHRAEVDAVAASVDEIEKMLAAQRTRIDLLLRRQIQWPMEQWRERYLEHGLIGLLARRLIWLVDGVPAIAASGKLLDVHDREVAGKTVRLWHPAMRSAEEVLAWRQKLEAMEITQPVKQAHREVYLLTDAERRTRTYSNRFAAHIIRNQQTLAITQVRKWKMGLYGGESSPSIELPHFKLRAEWWLQSAGDSTDRMGFPLYFASDQVRFYEGSEREPMELEKAPPLAFTEVMRDVDLFVSLASVGNNPEWNDGGPDSQFRTYWQSFSFGELTETAKTRKAVLERLVPRLRIAAQCTISDKFLIVQGSLRTYKIHLGSGNILMEPNDQYLCIVPDRRGNEGNGERVLLPFEGDQTLSIILSKAFLLADDRKITDATIKSQISHRTA